jgi:hypothetical protein
MRQLQLGRQRRIISARYCDTFSFSNELVYRLGVKFKNVGDIGSDGASDTEQLATLNVSGTLALSLRAARITTSMSSWREGMLSLAIL